ncbi:tRNA-uridine aminocarboxypropyltransferase 2-like [Artemia franciscana]|uniref:tRNA-uridine aminocarboxypropyltransferase 2-like n=1 Tax=Artemia franciscana TaxID=6661 RepID=UPI0032DA2ECC
MIIENLELSSSLHIEDSSGRKMCETCNRPEKVCWCPSLPNPRIAIMGRVVVLQHPAEEKRNLKTIPMLKLGLQHGMCTIIRGKKFNSNRFHENGISLDPKSTVLLYPGRDSKNIYEAAVELDRPYTIILIDGTWAQANAIYNISPVLHYLTKVTLKIDGFSEYVIRTQPSASCLSSVETAAIALSVLENDDSIKTKLLAPLRTLCDFQLNHGAVVHDNKVTSISEGKFRRKVGRRTEKFLRKLGVEKPPL